MENEKEKLVYPPPPDYYKEFTSPDKYSPPQLSALNQLDTFITFGNTYSTQDLNISYNPVEISTISKKMGKSEGMSNNKFFREIENKDTLNINCDNFNVIEELEKEIIFLRKQYKKLLSDISDDITKSQIKLIGISIQKINFYLISLRRKSILQKTIDFYNKEIDDCEQTSNKAEEGLKKFYNYLEENLEEFK